MKNQTAIELLVILIEKANTYPPSEVPEGIIKELTKLGHELRPEGYHGKSSYDELRVVCDEAVALSVKADSVQCRERAGRNIEAEREIWPLVPVKFQLAAREILHQKCPEFHKKYDFTLEEYLEDNSNELL